MAEFTDPGSQQSIPYFYDVSPDGRMVRVTKRLFYRGIMKANLKYGYNTRLSGLWEELPNLGIRIHT